MQTDHQKKGLLLPAINGDDSWELPIPATYLIGQDGVIVDAFLDADFYHRKDPQELVEELRKLAH
jgi:peroxiredoxin